MSSADNFTSYEVNRRAVNLTDDQAGPSAWAAGVGSTVMLVFFVEGLVGTCWILVALLRVAELRRNVVNMFVISGKGGDTISDGHVVLTLYPVCSGNDKTRHASLSAAGCVIT